MGARMVKRVLMIAFHFPPMRGSSGIQRTLKFAQYLPDNGWLPAVLSAHPRAYADPGNEQMGDIPRQVVVERAFALDTSRHLALRGRYLGWMALPDRWVTWLLGAVPAGLRMVRTFRPQLIWSTYPIATAHLIGLALHKLTGLPWVADMRDPMWDEVFPTPPTLRRVYRWVERKTLLNCSAAVCTTPGAIATFLQRYPDIPAARYHLIENAFDEENFADAESMPAPDASTLNQAFVLLHSGLIYPSERDPIPLFDAIASLQRDGALVPGAFMLVLRATGHDAYLARLIAERHIGELVKLVPLLPYRAALHEMLSASGLLILQASNCNHQVPAKLYEYLRARRPLLALTDAAGDTAATLRKAGIDTIAPLDDQQQIIAALQHFRAAALAGTAPLASAATVAANSRQSRAAKLAALLDTLIVHQDKDTP
jgi:hypothetical protein